MIEENLQRAGDKYIDPEQKGMWAIPKRFGELVRESAIHESLTEERAVTTMLRVISSRRKDVLVYYGLPITQIEASLFEAWKSRVDTPEMEKATHSIQEKLINKLVIEDRILTVDEAGNPTLTVFLRIGNRLALLSSRHSF